MEASPITLCAVRGTSGITYNISASNFDLETISRAVLGLTTSYVVAWCGELRMRAVKGYEFVLEEGVQIYMDCTGAGIGILKSELEQVEGYGYSCSCAVFQENRDMACHHIFVRATAGHSVRIWIDS